jgi:uncharacterized membrane protein
MKKTNFLVQAGVIAAIYFAITVTFAPISYGMVQVRISEALTILPFFTPAAIPGLFIGCLIANVFGNLGLLDIVFGSLATLFAAYLSYKMPKKYLVPIPPILVNAVVIGFVLYYSLFSTTDSKTSLLLIMGYIFIGQLISCYGIGYPLLLFINKYLKRIF